MSLALKALRKKRGITLKALSEATGIGVSTIGNFENGKYPMSQEFLSRVAKALSVDVTQISKTDPSESVPLTARDHHAVDYGTPLTIHGAAARAALARQEGEKREAFAAQDEARLIEFWKVVESVTPLMLRGGANVETCQQMIRAALDDFTAWCKAVGKKPEEPTEKENQ